MEEKITSPPVKFENLLTGFSISGTYAAFTLDLLNNGYLILAGVAFISCVLGLPLTYFMIYRPGILVGRLALFVAIAPVVVCPLLIYPVYKYGRYCLSSVREGPRKSVAPIGILKDACVFIPVLGSALCLLVVNPEYLFGLKSLSGHQGGMLALCLFLLCTISMAFFAAARFREKRFSFAKVCAFLFSMLFSVLALLVLILAPATVVMAKQMQIAAQRQPELSR